MINECLMPIGAAVIELVVFQVTEVLFSFQTVKALNYLKENLKIIHRGMYWM